MSIWSLHFKRFHLGYLSIKIRLIKSFFMYVILKDKTVLQNTCVLNLTPLTLNLWKKKIIDIILIIKITNQNILKFKNQSTVVIKLIFYLDHQTSNK